MSELNKQISDELLVNYLLQECSETDMQFVEEWLNSNAENLAYYNEFKDIWDQSKILQPTIEVDENQAWLRLKERMEKPKLAFFSTKILSYSIAASIALIIGLFFILKPSNPNKVITQTKKDKSINTATSDIVHTKKVETNTNTLIDTLSDKSIVTLNKNAKLECPEVFAEKERRVKLNGEAFFNITPNKEKPFFIDASNNVEIRVVGTSFNVKSFDAYTEVIVETGIVEVRKFNRVLLLHPKEKARINKKDSTIVVEKNKDKLYKYYRSKEFECDNTPLWKVVEVLNEAYDNRIIIGRKDLKSMALTTRFDNESLENIIEIISETFDITVEKQGNKFILK